MDTPRAVRVSKFLSLVLRHKPSAAGVQVDDSGWVSIDELLAGAARKGMRISREELDFVVEHNDKKRFALSSDGLRIRASQGHSVEVDLKLEPAVPPETLFHGTVARFVASIRASGLERRSRQHVHLSQERETAVSVGARRGEAVVLEIAAGEMHRDGHVFFRSANGVWLTEAVPARFVRE